MDTMTVDTEGAASYLGLATNTLEKMRVTGNGPLFAKLSRRVVYRVADLDAYLAKHIVQSTSERVAA